MRRKPTDKFRALGITLASAVLALSPALADDRGDDAKLLDDYRSRGLQAAMQTKFALGGALIEAIETGGPENAVAFCNTRAIPLTREMSDTLGVEVTRVSDQPRNPDNAADSTELAIIAAFKDTLARGEQPSPALREHSDTVTGYYPIVTNGMCLLCHGEKGVHINPATQAVIDSRYPGDRATGYGAKELRGLFVVTMDRVATEAGDAR